MNSRKIFKSRRRGSLAVTAIIALVVLMVIVLGLATAGLGVLRSGSHAARVRSLNNLSASGIQYGYWQYMCNYAALPYTATRNFGTGKFTVTVQDNSASITNTVVVSSTATLNNETLTTQRVLPHLPSVYYAADAGNNRVAVFTNFNGANWTPYGSLGTGLGQFNSPSKVILDNHNHFFIADTGNARIITVNDTTGAGWQTLGTLGSSSQQFNTPTDISMRQDNHFYISDCLNNRIVKIDNIGGGGWQAYGAAGSGVGQFNNPHSVAFDSQKRVYIADTYNHRIVRIDDTNGNNWVSYGSQGRRGGTVQRANGNLSGFVRPHLHCRIWRESH